MKLSIIRLLDFTLSLAGLICLLPLLLIVFALGLLDTGSPLFIQKRLGKHKKEFKLVKFRSMKLNSPQVGTHLANRCQITRLGKILRNTKLDELPQLWNVLKGDMSLVGARPGLPTQTTLLQERDKRQVFNYKPGITGLGQINEIDMSTPKKLSQYDQLMYKNINTCLYIKLILLTLKGKGKGDRVK